MIEGLQATISGTELKHLCESRAAYRQSRAELYQSQAEAIKEDASDTLHEPGSNSSSPRKGLIQKATEHSDEAAELRFIAAHLKANEDYQLGKSDLHRLGICRAAY